MEQREKRTKIYNVIIMDRSGSMESIKRAAIMGYNEVLQGVKLLSKKYASQKHHFSLVLFDSLSIDTITWNENPHKAPMLTDKSYVPGAATPLYDAIGQTITKLKRELKEKSNYSVVVTIITDGEENSSNEYSHMSVKRLIENRKKEGWSFAYMGTDHDVSAVSYNLSITNTIEFKKNEEDTLRNFKRERRARERYAKAVDGFSQNNPCATDEEMRNLNLQLSENYYTE